MADLLDEIKDDIKHERYIRVVREYGKYVLLAMVIIIVTMSGTKWWYNYQHEKAATEGMKLQGALNYISEENKGEAAILLEELQSGTGGYGVLAGFYQARILVEDGNIADAIELYKTIAKENASDPAIHDLALLLATHIRIENKKERAEDIAKTLETLSRRGRPWQYTAQEQLALYELHMNDNIEKAKEILSDLSMSPHAPSGFRKRAGTLLEILQAGGK